MAVAGTAAAVVVIEIVRYVYLDAKYKSKKWNLL